MDYIDSRHATIDAATAFLRDSLGTSAGTVTDVKLLEHRPYTLPGPNLSGLGGAEIAAWSVTSERYSPYSGQAVETTSTLIIDTVAADDSVTQRFDLGPTYTTEELAVVLNLTARTALPKPIGSAEH